MALEVLPTGGMIMPKKSRGWCIVCKRPIEKDHLCDTCGSIMLGCIAAPFAVLFLAVLISIFSEKVADKVVLPLISVLWFVALVIIVGRAIRAGAVASLLSGVLRLVRNVVAIIGILAAIYTACYGIGLVLVHFGLLQTEDVKAAKLHAESVEFRQPIVDAMRYKTESLRGHLVYPPHSLVVYEHVDPNVWWDEKGSSYHHACPTEWLSRKRNDVKLVALLSRGKTEEIGRYEPSGATAQATTWNVDFVDLATQSIVARAHIVHSDPQTVWALSPLEHIFEPGPWSPASENEVVSAIEETVSFGNSVKTEISPSHVQLILFLAALAVAGVAAILLLMHKCV